MRVKLRKIRLFVEYKNMQKCKYIQEHKSHIIKVLQGVLQLAATTGTYLIVFRVSRVDIGKFQNHILSHY